MAQDRYGSGESSSQSNGNGEPRERIAEHASDVRENAQAFAQSLSSTAGDVEMVLKDVTQQSPYLAVGVAAGIGFVLGGGIPPTLIRFAAGLAGRYVLQAMLTKAVGPDGVRGV